MPKLKDLTGRIFNRLTVIGRNNTISHNNRVQWNCVCACGTKKVIIGKYLLNGDTQSCGCLEHDSLIKRNTKHGFTGTSEYNIWKGIRQRCNNPTDPAYSYYGGRGIKICERWQSFENFLTDMGKRPSSDYSIDRIDNNGDYEPSNCRWATRIEQSTNTRFNRIIEFNGEVNHLNGWAKKFNIPVSTLHSALKVKPFDVVHKKYTQCQ